MARTIKSFKGSFHRMYDERSSSFILIVNENWFLRITVNMTTSLSTVSNIGWIIKILVHESSGKVEANGLSF